MLELQPPTTIENIATGTASSKLPETGSSLLESNAYSQELAKVLFDSYGWREALWAIAKDMADTPLAMVRAMSALAGLVTSNHKWGDRPAFAEDLDLLGVHPLALALAMVHKGPAKGSDNNAFKARTLAKAFGVEPALIQIGPKGDFRPTYWPDTISQWPKDLTVIATNMIFDGRGTPNHPPILPDGLIVAGSLYMRVSGSRCLPNGLQITGDLHLEQYQGRHAPVVAIPPDARIGGKVFTDACPEGSLWNGPAFYERPYLPLEAPEATA